MSAAQCRARQRSAQQLGAEKWPCWVVVQLPHRATIVAGRYARAHQVEIKLDKENFLEEPRQLCVSLRPLNPSPNFTLHRGRGRREAILAPGLMNQVLQ